MDIVEINTSAPQHRPARSYILSPYVRRARIGANYIGDHVSHAKPPRPGPSLRLPATPDGVRLEVNRKSVLEFRVDAQRPRCPRRRSRTVQGGLSLERTLVRLARTRHRFVPHGPHHRHRHGQDWRVRRKMRPVSDWN